MNALTKQFNEIQDQLEKAQIELSTFEHLQKQEEIAASRRLQVHISLSLEFFLDFDFYHMAIQISGYGRTSKKRNGKRIRITEKIFGITSRTSKFRSLILVFLFFRHQSLARADYLIDIFVMFYY